MKNFYTNLPLVLRSKITIVLLGMLFFNPHLFAQTSENTEQAEEESGNIWKQVYLNVKQNTGMTGAEYNQFRKYYFDSLSADMSRLSSYLAKNPGISKFEEQEIITAKESHYIQLFHTFQQIKAEFPSSVDEVLRPRKTFTPAGACNPQCTNMSFENGSLSGWECGYADCSGEGCSSAAYTGTTWQAGAGVTSAGPDANTGGSYQVILMSGAANDAATGGFPRVCPGYKYSAMVGDSTAALAGEPNCGVAFLQQTFAVTAANCYFYYNYAVVLNNPGHCKGQQPYFNVQMFDQNGDTIPHCGNYYVVAGGTNVNGSWKTLNGGTIEYLPWTAAFVPLRRYIGQCVTVQVTTSDCGLGGHWGYAYFVANCQKPGIITSSPTFCGKPIQLTAPGGATSYQWTYTGSGSNCITPAAGNTQTITANCAGTYTVIMIPPDGGAACADTIDTVMGSSISPPPVPYFTSDTVCAGNTTQFTNLTAGAGNTYHWTFTSTPGDTSDLVNPTFTFPAAGTYTVTLNAESGGCGSDTSLTVVVTAPPTAAFTANAVCFNTATAFTNTSTGSTIYSWNFGDPGSGANNTSTAANPTHTYSACGTYTAVLAVGKAGCIDSDKVTVTVNPAPTAAFTADTVCAGSVTTFNNTSAIGCGGAITTWAWSFGDPSLGANNTSTLQNPTVTFTGPLTYNVSLTATSSNGCQSSVTEPVLVAPVATANFTAGPVCLGQPTVFTDNSTNATTWNWNFGDGGTSTVQSPTHTYTTAGTFAVQLIVTAGAAACADTMTVNVTVNPNPVAAFTADSVCLGSPTTFTDASTGATAWSWTMGDGTGTSTLQNPAPYTYATDGVFPAKLVVTGTGGCTSTVTVNVVVFPVPTAAFTASTVCLGTATTFTDNSTGAATWQWSFGDGGTSTAQVPTHIYTTAGTFSVTLIVTASPGGCLDSTTVKVTVNPNPVAAFTADTVCQGIATTFTDKSTGATSWSWTFGDGGTSALQNPMHTYSAAGTYTVKEIVTTAAGCKDSATNIVTVNPNPTGTFTVPAVCLGTPSVFTSTVNMSAGGTYLWRFGDGSTSTLANPTHTYLTSGTFPVTLILDSKGCIDSVQENAVVNPVPVPAFSPDSSGCAPICVTFKDLSTPAADIASWLWNFGDGSPDSSSIKQNPPHCYTKVDSFTVTLTVTTNSGCTATLTKPNYIITWPTPKANFTDAPNPTTDQVPTVYFTDESMGNPVAWDWITFGDRTDSTSTSENSQHTYLYTGNYQDTGTYYVQLDIVNQYGCKDSIIEPVVINPEWTFYVPNAFTPNGDGLNDTFEPKGVGIFNFQMWIFDRWGMLLYHCTDMNSGWDGTVAGGSGAICQEDTYVYLIEFTDVFKNNHRVVGRVSIIR